MTRGCGKRKPGGVYICTKLSPHGVPLEEFIIDPPEAYEGEKFRVPIIFEKNGKNHLLFWVGKEFYPFPFRLHRGGKAVRRVEAGAGGVPDPETERGVSHVLRPFPRHHKEPQRASSSALVPETPEEPPEQRDGLSRPFLPGCPCKRRRKTKGRRYDLRCEAGNIRCAVGVRPGDIPETPYHGHRSRRLQGWKARPEGSGKSVGGEDSSQLHT